MQINLNGKVATSFRLTDDKEKAIIEFEDGGYITVELTSRNTSCHCHPEYEHYLHVWHNIEEEEQANV